MEIQDLRIGNYYLDSNKTPFILTKKGLISILKKEIVLNVIFPIPLTPEWLIKIGFESNNQIPEFLEIYRNTPYFFQIFKFDTNTWIVSGCNYKLEYLHQLQNLFFALKQKELSIK